MSLINDALRKARQAAVEHEMSQPGTAFRAPKAYPTRGPRRRGGVVLLVLVAAMAGLTGAALVWWTLDKGQPAVAAVEEPATEAFPKTVEPSQTDSIPAVRISHADPGNTADAPALETNGTGIRKGEPARGAVEETGALPGEHEAAAVPAGPPRAPDDTPAREDATPGERVFVLDADLGYATLSLGFIVARPVNPFAEINDIEVHIGSEVAGFVVEKIEPDQVVLRDDRGELVLKTQ